MKKNKAWIFILLISLGILLTLISTWLFSNGWLLRCINEFGQEPAKNTTSTNGEYQAKFLPLTNKGGLAPSFSLNGTSIFYLTPSGNLYLKNINKDTPEDKVIAELSTFSSLNWNKEMTHALFESVSGPNEGRSFGVFDYVQNEIILQIPGAGGGAWRPDTDYITYIQNYSIWQSGEKLKNTLAIADISDINTPVYIAWSSQGNRLVVQTSIGVSIYLIPEDRATKISWLPSAMETKWSPDGLSIVYRVVSAESDTLWMANLDGEEQRQVFKGVFSEFNWLPDGRLVFFTAAKEGGAACWALDPLTGTKELLADSSTVIYKPVGPIAVSPKGDALAFQAQDKQIWLLNFQNGFD